MLKHITTALATLATGALAVSPATNAATVLMIEPLNVGQGKMMTTELKGAMCVTNTCKEVDYPASLAPTSIPDGAAALDKAFASTTGQVIVFGYSEGAQVAETWLSQHADDADAPSAQNVTFLLIGNPWRKDGGRLTPFGELVGYVPSQTQYQVVDVARQYDGFADFPDVFASPGYPLAVANAVVGMFLVHSFYQNVDLKSPDNISWKDGNVTYVLAPTDTLPLLAPLESMGLGDLAHSLNTVLQPIVESAYSRPSPQASMDASHTSTGPSLIEEATSTMHAMIANSVQNMINSAKTRFTASLGKVTADGTAAKTDAAAVLAGSHTDDAKADSPVTATTQPAPKADGTTTVTLDHTDAAAPADSKTSTGQHVSPNASAGAGDRDNYVRKAPAWHGGHGNGLGGLAKLRQGVSHLGSLLKTHGRAAVKGSGDISDEKTDPAAADSTPSTKANSDDKSHNDTKSNTKEN
jgi:pimeloyl-ACP methyl ester carboxylesterase